MAEINFLTVLSHGQVNSSVFTLLYKGTSLITLRVHLYHPLNIYHLLKGLISKHSHVGGTQTFSAYLKSTIIVETPIVKYSLFLLQDGNFLALNCLLSVK